MHRVRQDLRAPPEVFDVTSIVSPELEMMDPTPDIQALKTKFDKQFFEGKVGNVTVSWSNRMTKAAGLCRYRKGVCSVKLSKPLLSLRSRKEMIETLLHELIHAYFFMIGKSKEHHGANFKRMMNWINQIAGTNITVYHSFHNEVRLHKNHWWQCNGICKKYVRRSKNSPPKPTEWGWAKHQKNCGGTFVKIAEPEKTKTGIPTGKAIRIKPLGSSNPAVPPVSAKKDQATGATKTSVTATGTQSDTSKKPKDAGPSIPTKKPESVGSGKPNNTGSTAPTSKIQKPGSHKSNDNQPPTSKPPSGSGKTKENKKPTIVELDDEPSSLISVFKKMVLDTDSSVKSGASHSESKAEIPVITLDDSNDDDEIDIFEFDEFDSEQELDDDSIIWI